MSSDGQPAGVPARDGSISPLSVAHSPNSAVAVPTINAAGSSSLNLSASTVSGFWWLIGQATAPRFWAARNPITKARSFGARIATRSPGPTPILRNPPAVPATSDVSSP